MKNKIISIRGGQNDTNATKKLLSIIVPVYNTEKYIANCIDSLLEQDIDMAEYEIICINDGSTDNSLMILKGYEDKYENITLIDKLNEGVAVARNTGLENATGEYVWFIDADDWIARNSLGLICEAIRIHNPSVIQVGFDWIQAEWRIEKCKNAALNKENVRCDVHQGVSILPYVGAWSSLIKKDILIRYKHKFIENLHYGEDVLFIRELFDRMKIEEEDKIMSHITVHCQKEIFYYYRLHGESACRSSWTKHREKYMDALLKMAHINQERMLDMSKPEWYRKQYEELFYKRMYNYMIDWFPGGKIELKKQLKQLKQDNLYPCPKPSKQVFEMLTKADGLVNKSKIMYKYFSFRWKRLYPIYYKQMRNKYKKANEI